MKKPNQSSVGNLATRTIGILALVCWFSSFVMGEMAWAGGSWQTDSLSCAVMAGPFTFTHEPTRGKIQLMADWVVIDGVKQSNNFYDHSLGLKFVYIGAVFGLQDTVEIEVDEDVSNLHADGGIERLFKGTLFCQQ